MKQCPKCGNSYTDDTLNFCLADGSALTVADEQPTVVRGSDSNKTEQLPSNVTDQQGFRVDAPTADQHAAKHTQQPQKKKIGSPILKIVLAVVALGFLVVLGAGVAGGVFYFYSGNRVSVSYTPTPAPSPPSTPWTVPSPAGNDDDPKLADEIAKLQKQIEEVANSSADDADVSGFGMTAIVNSPKDGFLALRNLPSTDIGERIAKIPHGETISILMCSEQSVTIGGRSGHWCMATYENKTGWVFDVWLSFATDSKN